MSDFRIIVEDIASICWPVVRATAKADLVRTPGGDLWIPKRARLLTRFVPTRLDEFLAGLTDLYASSRDALVAVRRCGKGPTDLSAVYQFSVREVSDEETRIHPRTLTLPLSLVADDRVPRWVIDEKLEAERTSGRRRLRGRQQSPVIAPWPGIMAVRSEIEAVIAAHRDQQEQAQQRWEAERPAREEAVRVEAERHRVVEDQRRQEAAAKAERAACAKAKRDVGALIVPNCVVHWTSWGGTSAQRVLRRHGAEGVTAVIRGAYVELRWPDGDEIKKKLDSKELRIEASDGWVVVAGGKVCPPATKPGTEPMVPDSAPALEPAVPVVAETKPKSKGGRPRVHADTAARVAAWRARKRDEKTVTKPPGRPRKWATDADRKAAWRARQRDEKPVT